MEHRFLLLGERVGSRLIFSVEEFEPEQFRGGLFVLLERFYAGLELGLRQCGLLCFRLGHVEGVVDTLAVCHCAIGGPLLSGKLILPIRRGPA